MNQPIIHHNNTPKSKNRRAFIHKLSVALGSSAAYSLVAGNSISVAFAYPPKKNSAIQSGEIFSQQQMLMLQYISDIILPKTDTPSGSELDCHGFVDNQIKHCHSKKKQLQSIKILQRIEEYSKSQHQLSFNHLPINKQTRLIKNIEALINFTSIEKQQFTFIKWLIVYGYFTSEIGATQALNYQAIPGGFKGSIAYKKEDKSWGSLAYY